jgi:hypothetical protein
MSSETLRGVASSFPGHERGSSGGPVYDDRAFDVVTPHIPLGHVSRFLRLLVNYLSSSLRAFTGRCHVWFLFLNLSPIFYAVLGNSDVFPVGGGDLYVDC